MILNARLSFLWDIVAHFGEKNRNEGNAFGVGGNNIYTLAAVVGKGWAKGKSATPVRGHSVAVVGNREGKTELARG